MELFTVSLAGRPLLLSASDTGLFLHTMQNERFGRPSLLCSNYKNGLCGCLSNESLYYAYINRDNSLLLRRLHESALLFRLDSSDTVSYHKPQLLRFNNFLFLFYFENKSERYCLRLQLPFSDSPLSLPEPLCASFSVLPSLSLMTTEHHLYLFLTVGATTVSYRYSPTASFEQISTESDFLSGLRLPWETEKEQLEQALLQAVHLSEKQQSLLTEKEQKLQLNEARLSELSSKAEQTNTLLSETTKKLQITQAQLTECEQNRQQTAQELNHMSHLLERAKTQYNELMQIAEQYRQEALKWYGKFTDRH